MIKPLTSPSPSPTSGARASPSDGSWLSPIQAADTDATAKIAPVDRSNPPAMMTSVPAIATIASGAFWVRMLSRLRLVRKASLWKRQDDHQQDDQDQHPVAPAEGGGARQSERAAVDRPRPRGRAQGHPGRFE